MAAGESGVSGQCVVWTVRGSAAESAQLRSPSMGDGCVTGWRWLQTTAQAASVHRVGNTKSTLHWLKRRKREWFSIITVSPIVFTDCVIIDLLFIIFGSVG